MSVGHHCISAFYTTIHGDAYHGEWLPTCAWRNILFNHTGEDYTEKSVTKALKLAASNLQSVSTSDLIILHHKKSIQIQKSVWKHVHFFLVEKSNKKCRIIECDGAIWQKRYNLYASKYQQSHQKHNYSQSATHSQNISTTVLVDQTAPGAGTINSHHSFLDSEMDYCNLGLDATYSQVDNDACIENALKSVCLLPVNLDASFARALAPETFDEATMMVIHAWKQAYTHIDFPFNWTLDDKRKNCVSQGVQTDNEAEVQEAADHNGNKKCGCYNVQNVSLPNGYVVHDLPNHYCCITRAELAKYNRQRQIVYALESFWNNQHAQTTERGKMLQAAFAASHPTIPTAAQALLIGLSRFTLWLDIEAHTCTASKADIAPFVDLQKMLNVSPSARTIDYWVDQLAVDQAVIVGHGIKKAESVFLQSDHTPDGSLAKVLTYFDTDDKSKTADGSIQQFFLGIEETGKKSEEIADGIDHALTSIGLCDLILAGTTSDSGGGTPEASYNALVRINRALPDGTADSCGLHDMQSIF